MKCHVTLVPGRFALEFSSVGQTLSAFSRYRITVITSTHRNETA